MSKPSAPPVQGETHSVASSDAMTAVRIEKGDDKKQQEVEAAQSLRSIVSVACSNMIQNVPFLMLISTGFLVSSSSRS